MLFSRILWHCAVVYNMIVCPRIAKEQAVRRGLKATIFDCNCEYGAEGENFSNAKFEILPVPISNGKEHGFDSRVNLGSSLGFKSRARVSGSSLAVRRGLKATIFDCNCEYGAEGENFSNEKFEILPVPISNVLTCKKGDFDSDGYGGAYKAECSHDEDQYCYMASCAKGNELVRTEWNCSPDTDCTEISAKVGETVNATVTCECRFGKANASLANENFTLPMVPTINADKPTKNADKPTNTTAEANLGVRAKISVCSGVLMAIGHVFASVLPKLGLGGQLLNDL
uniref:EGF-like domain-containing protein n=1 Tax=Globodera pallida TaxID=36090 RepID=A0A183BNC1_GLOPA